MDYLEKAKQVFADDKFATETTGIEIISAAPDYAKCQLKIEARHLNALGAVMGGVIFTMADFTFAIASNIGGCITVTLTSQINYLNSPKGQLLLAEATPVKSGRSTCVFDININDELGTHVARVSVTGFRKA